MEMCRLSTLQGLVGALVEDVSVDSSQAATSAGHISVESSSSYATELAATPDVVKAHYVKVLHFTSRTASFLTYRMLSFFAWLHTQ